MDKGRHRDALPVGYKLLWYELRSILGQGGFGITYLAQDTNLNQSVAIKEYLPSEFALREEDSTVRPATGEHGEIYRWGLDRFMVEAQTLARFRHPNIVRVLSVFPENNTAYMVMEYEHGEELGAKLRRGELCGEIELLGIVLPILDGLARVHEAGFIHRDIKPANIFIRADGSPVLLDFGSARQAVGHQTRALTSLVTGGYAPFEQYHEDGAHQGPWTDIYALGATLYKAITDTLPADALIRGTACINGYPDPYFAVGEAETADYSAHFLAAVDSALRFRESDRPQTAREWMVMLRGEGALGRSEYDALRPVPEVESTLRTATMDWRGGTGRQETSGLQERRGNRAGPSPEQASGGFGRPGKVDQATDSLPEFLAPGRAAAAKRPSQVSREGFRPNSLTNKHKPFRRTGQLLVGGGALLLAALAIWTLRYAYDGWIESDNQQARVGQGSGRLENQQEKQKQKTIANLLKQAEQDLQASRYTLPRGDNALERYRQVLELDSNNEPATKGLTNLVNLHLKRAEQAIANDQFADAQRNLNIVDQIQPDGEAGRQAWGKLARREAAKEQTDRRTREQAESARPIQAQTDRIDRLLAAADRDFEAGRLVEPAEHSALDKYREVLSIEAQNADAQAGMMRLVEHLVALAAAAAEDERFADAREYLDKAEAVIPGAKEVRSGWVELIRGEAVLEERKRTETVRQARTRAKTERQAVQGQKRIAELLALAEDDVRAARFTKPEGRNALERYREVLRLDQGNAKAQTGITRLLQHYLRLADQAIDGRQFQKAKYHLKSAAIIQADADALRLSRAKLAEAEAEFAAFEQRERLQQQAKAAAQAKQERVAGERNTRITELLALADRDFQEARFSTPAGSNALERYRYVLALDSDNAEAKAGMSRLFGRFLELADQAVSQGEFDTAARYQTLAGNIEPDGEDLLGSRAKLAGRKAALEEQRQVAFAAEVARQTGRADIEIVAEKLHAFQVAFSDKDISRLRQIVELSAGRLRFIEQLFNEYQTIEAAISNVSLLSNKNRASAVLTITKLTNSNGDQVIPGNNWKQANIEVLKQDNLWGDIRW